MLIRKATAQEMLTLWGYEELDKDSRRQPSALEATSRRI